MPSYTTLPNSRLAPFFSEKSTNYLYILVGISLAIRLFCLEANSLLVEEAYYWNYALHLDYGYLDHPPMVALLIKLSTTLFGTTEFAVRIFSLLCWIITSYFSFKLTNLVAPQAGKYAVLLLAILPFFFIHSLVITPDQPLNACWAAALYYLYRALVLNESNPWYFSGLWLGLGMISKYTIVLLGPATLLYLLLNPSARYWFARKEPYFCTLIVLIIFSPVVYWNATHEWVSFVFQSTGRMHSKFSFYFPHFIGLLLLFLTPLGIYSAFQLFKRMPSVLTISTQRFLQIFTLVPLLFFGIFSLTHIIRFNWIGPGLLAIIPWIAFLIKNQDNLYRRWYITAVTLLVFYTLLIIGFIYSPEGIQQKFLKKFIAWDDLTTQLYDIAKQVEIETHSTPIFAALDLYNINSELSFYQHKFLARGVVKKTYPVIGRHIFGVDSLMYRYWSALENISNRYLILISTNSHDFALFHIANYVCEQSPIKTIWSRSQSKHYEVSPYFYQIVRLN